MLDSRGNLTGVDLARIRQGSFRLLAAGYGRPDLIATESIGGALDTLGTMGVGAFSYATSFWDWGDALLVASGDIVGAEYVRLFGSGMDGAVCPPIESQQLGANLQGDPARHAGRIEDLMRRSGFSRADDERPPDHLVVELELASALCGAEATARSDGEAGLQWLEWQHELIAVLAMWLPKFTEDVVERDRSGVFAALSRATDAFVQHELDMVRMLISAAGGSA